MKKRLGVIGVGSAGIVTMCHFLAHMSNEWDVVSIYDPTVPILGIGESTNPSFIRSLELGTRFSTSEDAHKLDGTLKFGTKFIGWREKDWLNPLLSGGVAVHFNNFKLKEFAFSRFPELWPEKFKVIEGRVDHMDNTDDDITLTINGNKEVFDYVIDCGGFATDFTDIKFSDCTLMNHCLIHSFNEHRPIQYTEHIATKNGWMFGVPLTSRMTYGYLFNDEITSLEDARLDMAEHLKIKVEDLDSKEYKFKAYYTTKVADKRLMKNGNRALFFEPISATSINQYCSTNQLLFKYIVGQASEIETNVEFIHESNVTEDILNFYYHGGTTYDSKFWQTSKANALEQMKGNFRLNFILDYNQRATEMGLPYNGHSHLFSQYSLVIMDEAFGYNYFKGAPRPFNQTS